MIAAIDPGSEKTGFAVLCPDGTLAEKAIIPTKRLALCLTEAYKTYAFTHIVMGSGTNHQALSGAVEAWIKDQGVPVTFSLIDEKNTTVEGRRLYFRHTPRRGWRRFVPLSLQYPPEPVDDFVAWIIGLRYLHQQGGSA